jgi:hypothetical protein
MALFGDYTGQALANMEAMRSARARVINNAEAVKERLRSDPNLDRSLLIARGEGPRPAPSPLSGGKGRLFNIYV